MTMTLDELITELRKLREEVAHFKADEAAIVDEYALRLAVVRNNRKDTEDRVAQVEAAIREAGIQAYNETGNKKPAQGVEIKLFTETTIEDQDAARGWAFTNLPAALMLDTKKVSKYAEEFGAVPGVTVKTGVPRAQIATKL